MPRLLSRERGTLRYTLLGYTVMQYAVSRMAIQSFADRTAEAFFVDGTTPKGVGWSTLSRVVVRKLDMLDYAGQLSDLGSPPGNRLEALKGEMKGMYSIRINEQWRIVFRWTDSGPTEVQIRDYHRG